MPPVRSGHIVASSARHRQRRHPAIVITPIRMMPSAPVPWTTYGAMPVTRIVPARPMTNAPHQLVPLTRPFSGIAPPVPVTAAIALAFRGCRRVDAAPGLEQGEVAAGLPVADHRV